MNGLTELDRWKLLELLGLTSFPFRYEERLGPQLIRSWICSENGVEAQFPGAPLPVSPLPTLVRAHTAPFLSEAVLFKNRSLWAECLPFPFSSWAESYGAEASGEISSLDEPWWAATQRLRSSFQALEEKIFSCEVTHLHIERPGNVPATSLFFHCVRRKYLEIRKLDALEASSVGETPVASRYQALHLHSPQEADFVSQVDSLCSAIRKTLEAGVQSSLHRDNVSLETRLPL